MVEVIYEANDDVFERDMIFFEVFGKNNKLKIISEVEDDEKGNVQAVIILNTNQVDELIESLLKYRRGGTH